VTGPARATVHTEGLRAARLLMVLSSISPLFILWAIRGNTLIPSLWFLSFCAAMVIVPNAFLCLRISIAKSQDDKRQLHVGGSEDHRDHILVYLFAMLLPFYSEAIGTWRDFGATLAALAFIVFLFWHLNLHYMNLIFAARGLRVFTIYSGADNNSLTSRARYALITKRVSLVPGDRIIAYRLSDTVYLETN